MVGLSDKKARKRDRSVGMVSLLVGGPDDNLVSGLGVEFGGS